MSAAPASAAGSAVAAPVAAGSTRPAARAGATGSGACTGCGRPIPLGLSRCQVCGGAAAGMHVDSRREGLKAGLAELVREHARDFVDQRRRDRRARIIDTALFLLMSPFAAPSIALTFLQARRWGRIPIPMIVFDVFLLLALSKPLALLLGFSSLAAGQAFFNALLLGMLAFAALAVRRAAGGKLPHGIFLGYSNLTLLPLVGGGLILALGTGRILSSGPTPQERRLTIADEPESMAPAEAASLDLAGGFAHVELEDARLDEGARVWRVERGGGGFTQGDPREAVPASAEDLVADPDSWLGTCVTIQPRYFTDSGFWVNGREYDEVKVSPRGSLWIVSPGYPAFDGPGAAEYRAARSQPRVGIVVKIDREALAETGFQGLPKRPLGVLATPITPEDVAQCAPVAGTGSGLWVSWRGSAPATLRGVLEQPGPDETESLAALIRAKDAAFAGKPRVLVVATPAEFRTLRGLGKAPPARPAGGTAWWMALGGLLLLGVAGWRAAGE